ncbi:MAG TPA: 3-deoxy-D-manno-octulosonic acid transferase [Vicinamibacteria bacterium]|nr:3-deoxy-D-manno-octulosonic acid transferase [Vicinamibacteria bacterium]
MYAIYSALLSLAFVLALPWYLWKDRGTGRYRASFRERFGRLPAGLPGDGAPAVWVHAVSVGEVLAARPLLRGLRQRLRGHRIVLSTTTVTGQALARQGATDADAVFFAPFDWTGPVRAALAAVRPSLLVLVETELWPNLIHQARRAGVRVAVANGRISPRSFRRYRLVRGPLRRVLGDVDLFLMQAEAHAERIRALGAPPERVRVTGNLKYDALPAGTPRAGGELARLLGAARPGQTLWVAGSTVPGEEEHVLRALRQVRERVPGLRLVIAPRHPERFADVLALAEKAGFTAARRTALGAGPWSDGDVLVLDTMGELPDVYPLAAVVFVGGSLERAGGHNVLEPAVAGMAVVVGPHMENFQEIAEEFRREGALVQVGSPAELPGAITLLLTDPERRRAIGERARALVARNRGAVAGTVEALADLLPPGALR